MKFNGGAIFFVDTVLNCFYKLISRVLTNRLKKVSDKITSVGQYGYSKKKHCQEVLIGLLNKIEVANKEKKAVFWSP
jgi:hypothetical protein